MVSILCRVALVALAILAQVSFATKLRSAIPFIESLKQPFRAAKKNYEKSGLKDAVDSVTPKEVKEARKKIRNGIEAAAGQALGIPVLTNSSEEYDHYYHLHIPKTGGASFAADLIKGGGLQLRINGTFTKISTNEGCFDFSLPLKNKKAKKVIVMFRDPVAQVQSIFAHCATSPEMAPMRFIGYTKMPNRPEQWLKYWSTAKTAKGFDSKEYYCYNPVDMQSHRMTCDFTGGECTEDVCNKQNVVDIERAVSNMRSSFFVGITELYAESQCLLHARVYKELPKHCGCGSEGTQEGTHLRHGNAGHSIEDLNEEEVKLITDRVAAQDIKLYRAAVQRFKEDIAEAESTYGRKILCPGRLARLKRV